MPQRRRTTTARAKARPKGKLEGALASLRAEVLILRLKIEALEAMAATRVTAEVDGEAFLRELHKVHSQRATPLGTAAIPDLRDSLCGLLHIAPAAFDRVLLKCWVEGKVELEVGSPIGRPPGGHLEHQGKRYYYVRLP